MSVRCPEGHTSASTDYCDVCGAPIPAGGPGSGGPAAAPAGVPEAGPTASGTASGPVTCPSCSELSPGGSLFCENCGYDFTTGTPPAPAPEQATPPSALDLGDLARGSGGPVPVPGAPADPAQASPASGQAVVNPAPAGGDGSARPRPAGERGAGLAAPPVPGQDTWVAEVWIDPDWYLEQDPEDPLPSPGLPGLVTLRQRSLLVGRPSTSRGIHPDIDCGADSGVSRRHCQLSTDGQRWWVEDLQSANGTFVATAGDPLPTTPLTAGQRREVGDGDRVYVGGWTRLVIRRALPGEA